MTQISPDTLLVGRIAVERGMLTEGQLARAVAEQERQGGRPLGEVLVDLGLATPDQLARLLEAQRERLQEPDASRHRPRVRSIFGKLAVRLGHASPATVNRALRMQEEARQRGDRVALGQVLVRLGAMSDAQVRAILEIQRTRLCACPECGHFYDLRQFAAGEVPSCRRCRVPVLLPDALAAADDAPEAGGGGAAETPTESGLFGAVAVAKGYVSRAQVDEGLAEQARTTAGGAERPRLGDVLVGRGALDAERRDAILAVQREILGRTGHVRFGQAAVRKGFLGQTQLDEALRRQASAEAVGYRQPLGAVLVQMGALTLGQVGEILRELPRSTEKAERLRRVRASFRRRLAVQRAAGQAAWVAGAAAAALLVFLLMGRGGERPRKATTGGGTPWEPGTGETMSEEGSPVAAGPAVPGAAATTPAVAGSGVTARPTGIPEFPDTPPAEPTLLASAATLGAPPARAAPPATLPARPSGTPASAAPSLPPTRPLAPASRTEARPGIDDPNFLQPRTAADAEAEREVYRLSRRYGAEVKPLPAGAERARALDTLQRDLGAAVRRYASASSRYAQLWGFAAVYQQALAWRGEGRHREAAEALQSLVAKYPAWARGVPDSPLGNGALLPSWLGAHRSLALVFQFGVKDEERAMAVHQQMATRFPQSDEADAAWDFIGTHWERRGDYDRAMDAYRRVRALGAEYVPAWVDACRKKKDRAKELPNISALIERRDYAGALAQLEAEFRNEPLAGEPAYLRGVALLGLGRRAEAAASLRASVSQFPLGPAAGMARKLLQGLEKQS